MWREIRAVSDAGVEVHLFSTRRPIASDRARHGFADEAERSCVYLGEAGWASWISSLIWALVSHPLGLLAAAGLVWRGRSDAEGSLLGDLMLVPPACVLAKCCSRNKIDRLHIHSCGRSAILGVMAKRICGVSFSLVLNADLQFWGGRLGIKFAEAERVYCITEWLLHDCKNKFASLPDSRFRLCRIGVDVAHWPSRHESSDHLEQLHRVITVGRLNAAKRIDLVIRAIAALRDRGVDAELRIAGDGPERERLESLIAELGLQARVVLLGSVSESQVKQELLGGSVFVLPSRSEPLGVVYMEAMATGAAVIGTRAGGVGEIIDDGIDGLLVDPHSFEDLVDAVERCLVNSDLRRQLGRAGRRKIEERFDSSIAAKVLLEDWGVMGR